MSEIIGRYECIKKIGQGGMGEILLALDPVCDRKIALKRIRPDLPKNEVLKNRFLREAKITSRLTHPGIISIYSIHQESDEIYYTMPYVEGETLKQLLRQAYQNENNPKYNKGSIPSLLQIFKNICQTIAYAHSRGVLHRDLKPENILVGKYGEVIILDWGLAQITTEFPHEIELAEEITHSDPSLTSPGKLVGTVAYMAPERALGAPATNQTDLYALGVILYQILTLHLPFERTSIKEFSKIYKREKLLDPEEVAPYREVPPRLSQMVKKFLNQDPALRYHSMDEIIYDLMGHMEGRSEWFEMARLDIAQKKHWEFQENLLISKHIAITRTTETADWVSIMVSKRAFSENTRISTRIRIGKSGKGIGFLLSIPESAERKNPLEGYCLWIGSDSTPAAQLFRNTVEVMHQPEICLKKGEWYSISIEKIDHNILFILNGQQQFTYLSYLPLSGTHIGVLARDDDFEMEPIVVSSGSQNLTVSCLSIPDAFLASKDYIRALAEYRRIGYSFPGHAEGREALFRAGITLLEQAKFARAPSEIEEFYTLALEEFAKLHKTPGAPLEYLGKALVYKSLKDHSEEIKCLELGLRRYRKHPLVDALCEQIVYRMHEASQNDRRSTYQLILIVLRLLPSVVNNGDSIRLFKHLVTNWEPLPFLETTVDPALLGKEKNSEIRFAIPLAFWLGSPYILLEMFQELIKLKLLDIPALGDLIYSLFELGSYELANQLIVEAEGLKTRLPFEEATELANMLALLKPIWTTHNHSLQEAIPNKYEDIGVREFRTLSYLMQFALQNDQVEFVHEIAAKIESLPLAREDRIRLDGYRIWAYLKEKKWEEAEKIFDAYPMELLNQESTLLHALYGCYLFVVEGEEIATIHFAGVIDTPFPRSWALLGHEITNKITESVAWFSNSFMWERRQLYRQLELFAQCADNSDLAAYYRHLEREEYIHALEAE